MAVRDRIAVGLIAAGALLAIASWHSAGRWLSVVVLLLALLAAAVAYRIEAPHDRPPLDDDPPVSEQTEEVSSGQ